MKIFGHNIISVGGNKYANVIKVPVVLFLVGCLLLGLSVLIIPKLILDLFIKSKDEDNEVKYRRSWDMIDRMKR